MNSVTKEFDLDAYLQYNLEQQAQMKQDLELLRTIKSSFEHELLAHELKLVNQYISIIKNNNYALSKKNLSRLEIIINNLHKRQQAQTKAKEQAPKNDLFEN